MVKAINHIPQEFAETNKSIYGEESLGMKNFVVGTVVGGLVGAAAALLLAPKTGVELRSDVVTQASSLKEKGVELSSTAKEKTVQISSQLKEQSSILVEKVKAKTSKEPTTEDGSEIASLADEEIVDLAAAIDDAVTGVTAGIEKKASVIIDELLVEEPVGKN